MIGGSLLARDADGHVRNAYLLVTPDGVAGRHDKDLPTMWENAFYIGGHHDGVIAAGDLTVGAAVCWEFMRTQTVHRLRWRRPGDDRFGLVVDPALAPGRGVPLAGNPQRRDRVAGSRVVRHLDRRPGAARRACGLVAMPDAVACPDTADAATPRVSAAITYEVVAPMPGTAVCDDRRSVPSAGRCISGEMCSAPAPT